MIQIDTMGAYHLAPARADTLAEYAGRLAKTLDLIGWKIEIQFLPLEGAEARTMADVPYRQALIQLDPAILRGRWPCYRATVMHEMWHLVLWPLWAEAVETAIEATEDDGEHEAVARRLARANEAVVTHITYLPMWILGKGCHP